jgi:hypothetical protein
MVDDRLIEEGRVGEVSLVRTRVSDHDITECNVEIQGKRKKQCYDRIPKPMIEDEEFEERVTRIFEEEKGGEGSIMERHERFKKMREGSNGYDKEMEEEKEEEETRMEERYSADEKNS